MSQTASSGMFSLRKRRDLSPGSQERKLAALSNSGSSLVMKQERAQVSRGPRNKRLSNNNADLTNLEQWQSSPSPPRNDSTSYSPTRSTMIRLID